jgi:deoxyribodipyrimidine photo-lyase
MRQLKEENWMHGRVRMIVASFLTKDLHVDRKIGEEHFRDYLIDYDTNVNIGNRQWSASVGADPKPLRIFNPILQSERYDPLAKYIKKRVPEIADQEIKAIHNPLKYDLQYTDPIVDHYHMSREAKEMYKKSTEQFKTLNK